MPRLMLFAACEKVIVGQEDNAGSLISILQGFDIPTAPDPAAPSMAPFVWYAFALWETARDEVPGFAVQRIQLVAPDKKTILLSAEVPVIGGKDKGKRFHRAALRRQGFVLVGVGDYMLRLSLKLGDAAYTELKNVAFPIPVTISPPKPTGT
jgi:hypothetical protein